MLEDTQSVHHMFIHQNIHLLLHHFLAYRYFCILVYFMILEDDKKCRFLNRNNLTIILIIINLKNKTFNVANFEESYIDRKMFQNKIILI